VGAPSMDVDRRRLQEEIVDLLGDGVYRFGSEVLGVEDGRGPQVGECALAERVPRCPGHRERRRERRDRGIRGRDAARLPRADPTTPGTA
jgi:hypothetical protein